MHGASTSRQNCPEGQTRLDGQCVPTSTVVFWQCIEAFRTQAVERAQGRDVDVHARALGYGDAGLRSSKQQRERHEYGAVQPGDLPEAIAECRRQEQAERDGQLRLAWAETHRAREESVELKGELARRDRELETLQTTIAEAAQAHEDLESSHRELLTLVEERLPCSAGAWDRCLASAVEADEAGDVRRAHAMYVQACDGERGQACANLGRLLQLGRGIEVDLRAATEAFERACTLGHHSACIDGAILRAEAGDLGEARVHRALDDACEDGDANACITLARAYERGRGVSASEPRALEYFEHACAKAHGPACLALGDLLVTTAPTAMAIVAYERGCDHGEGLSCVKAARVIERRGEREAAEHVRTLYHRGCEAGEPLGCEAWLRVAKRQASAALSTPRG